MSDIEPVTELENRTAAERAVSADLDLEMALLAALASKDIGEATEPVRLDTLAPVEKEVLLQLIRGQLGRAETPSAVVTASPGIEKISTNGEEDEDIQ